MRDQILIVGEDLELNEPFLDYIFSQINANFGKFYTKNFIEKNSKDLPFVIENLAKKTQNLLIFASDENFSIVSKILATLTTDILELKEQTLMPSMTKIFKQDSFVLELESCKINLIKSNPCEKLPEILLKSSDDSVFFYIFDIDKDSTAILLEPLANSYNVEIKTSQIVPNLILICARSKKFGNPLGFLQSAKNLFINKIIESGDIFEFCAKKLMEKNIKISFAESCTTGLLASKFGKNDGISLVFDGSIVSYSNEVKSEWLGVGDEILSSFGAVSEPCVKDMCKGAISLAKSNLSISISGIAGSSGGSKEKPVGTIFIGIMRDNGEFFAERILLSGDRNYIRQTTCIYACVMLFRVAPEIFFG